MSRYYKKWLTLVAVLIIAAASIYVCRFYPQQIMPIGKEIIVKTIDSTKYHHDCLHPCIRYNAKNGKYYMSQSPYYRWNNKVENPMFYSSDDYMRWDNGVLLAQTPMSGFNSDPNICIHSDGTISYIWRECYTPFCDSLDCANATVGGIINDEGVLESKDVYCINYSRIQDQEQAPVMTEHEGFKYIYATWYQYDPKRKNKGIAIWQEDATSAKGGGRMCKCQFVDTIPFESTYTVDKCAQVRLFNHIFYCPRPQYHDLWHYDLFEYADKLYMVSVAEKGDNIMLSVADDWRNFKTYRKPLVNNHYTENYCGYRQYYYKPTAFVQNDTLHLFYTANAKEDFGKNQLYHTQMSIKQVLK